MARETRRQRRDARRQGDGAEASAGRSRFPVRQPVEGGGDAAIAQPAPRELSQPRSGFLAGTVNFIRESWGELKKVDWPKRPQVVQGTIVVLVACAIIGFYLWGVDQLIRPFVHHVLLGN
jgi:preprotein translocase subunit SecE